MQQQQWENYDTTKECIFNTTAAAMGGDWEAAMAKARKVGITCCSCIGRYQLNKLRPISISFQ